MLIWILLLVTSTVGAVELSSPRDLSVTSLGPYAQALRLAGCKTLGEVTDLSEFKLRQRAKLSSRDVQELQNILAGHKLRLFGREFASMGVGSELGEFLARHGLRTPEAFLNWKPHSFLHVRKSAPELTVDELEELRLVLRYPGLPEDMRVLVDVRQRLRLGEDPFGCGEPLGRKKTFRDGVINSVGPRPPNSFTR